MEEKIMNYKKKLEKKTCTIKELSEMLQISESKARKLTRIEGFPVINIGKNKRIVLSRLDSFLEACIGEEL